MFSEPPCPGLDGLILLHYPPHVLSHVLSQELDVSDI